MTNQNDFALKIAGRLRDVRQEFGDKQEELALEIGTTQRAISSYEQAEAMPSAYTLAKYTEYYGISADWLLGITNKMERVRK